MRMINSIKLSGPGIYVHNNIWDTLISHAPGVYDVEDELIFAPRPYNLIIPSAFDNEYIKKLFKQVTYTWLNDSYLRCQNQHIADCPICHKTHGNANYYIHHNKLVGYSDKCEGHIELDVTKVIEPSLDVRPLIQTQHCRYIDFDILSSDINKMIFIKSALGTGKTHMLQHKIIPKFDTILMVSPRITFTDSVSSRLGFESYRDIDNKCIKMKDAPKLVL